LPARAGQAHAAEIVATLNDRGLDTRSEGPSSASASRAPEVFDSPEGLQLGRPGRRGRLPEPHNIFHFLTRAGNQNRISL